MDFYTADAMKERRKATRSARRSPRFLPSDWEQLRDSEILAIRVRDLGLNLAGSPLQANVDKLYAELDAHGIRFRPPCYLADEWLCPDKEPIIGIPFFLAHPRLLHIEKQMMFEAEGETTAECMQLLRHECGHALNYAYRLYARTRWRELFGRFSARYAGTYSFQPYSHRYVVHLPNAYAQSHPDEDFAETFAVWLTPGDDWREKYREWPALAKLEYVDRVITRLAAQPPVVAATATPWSAGRMTSTLDAWYERKRRYLGPEFEGYYDGALRGIFAPHVPGNDHAIPASKLLRRYRRNIMDSVAAFSGLRKYDLHELLNKLVRRCDILSLFVEGSDTDALIRMTSLVSAAAVKSFKGEEGENNHQ